MASMAIQPHLRFTVSYELMEFEIDPLTVGQRIPVRLRLLDPLERSDIGTSTYVQIKIFMASLQDHFLFSWHHFLFSCSLKFFLDFYQLARHLEVKVFAQLLPRSDEPPSLTLPRGSTVTWTLDADTLYQHGKLQFFIVALTY
jgi:hypothetical protein